MKFSGFVIGALSLMAFGERAEAKIICTYVMDAKTENSLVEDGDCKTRVTPASTFKVALSVIGYDAGFLKDEHHPQLDFQKGDPDWGGDAWKQKTDPVRWLKYSVVWYSQRITHALGEQKLHDYAVKLDYGNADFSGDPGEDNGLQRAWIMSSLKISPTEQVAFLKKLTDRSLPVSPQAMDLTMKVVEQFDAADGWVVHGKTGTAFPRKPDGSFDESHGYGWFVGWSEKNGRRLIFARLIQDDEKQADSPGVQARAFMLADLPKIAGQR